MKKFRNGLLKFIGISLFSILNYFIYRRILYSYISQTSLAHLAHQGALFLFTYLISSAVYFSIMMKQLLNKKIHKNFIKLSFIIYLPILTFILFGKSIGVRGFDLNIFSVFNDLKESSLQCLINMFLFIPIGLLIKSLNWKKLILFLILIFFVEMTQYIFALGIFDVVDILFNYLGLLIGYRLRIYLKQRQIQIV